MGWPIKVYLAKRNGEDKIQILVFDVQGRCYSAVMIPLARDDTFLMNRFQDPHTCHETGETIEAAVANCEKWIKENLWDDVDVIEEQKS